MFAEWSRSSKRVYSLYSVAKSGLAHTHTLYSSRADVVFVGCLLKHFTSQQGNHSRILWPAVWLRDRYVLGVPHPVPLPSFPSLPLHVYIHTHTYIHSVTLPGCFSIWPCSLQCTGLFPFHSCNRIVSCFKFSSVDGGNLVRARLLDFMRGRWRHITKHGRGKFKLFYE